MYNSGKHDLVWNGKLGKVPFAEDEGLIHCRLCQGRWYWKDRANNLSKTVCPRSAEAAERERAKSKAGIQAWLKANPSSHDLDYEEDNLRWKCKTCGVNGALGFGKRFEQAVGTPCKGRGQRLAGKEQGDRPGKVPRLAGRAITDELAVSSSSSSSAPRKPHSAHLPRRGVG